jgi:hypothetical protein
MARAEVLKAQAVLFAAGRAAVPVICDMLYTHLAVRKCVYMVGPGYVS